MAMGKISLLEHWLSSASHHFTNASYLFITILEVRNRSDQPAQHNFGPRLGLHLWHGTNLYSE